MNSTLFITSSHGNHYMYDFSKREFMYVHPLIHICYLFDKAQMLDKLVQSPNEEGLSILKKYGEENVKYHLNKYIYMKSVGYFGFIEKPPFTQYTGQSILQSIANVNNIVFEVTDACNLACTYCINREMYSTHMLRKKTKLPFNATKATLDYLVPLWNSELNKSPYKDIIIGFYGGEPLVNFPTIKECVEYCKKIPQRIFKFMMTTNGTLLDQHMDFLVKNNFRLTISLDGNSKGQSYRTFSNGKNSFNKVYSNLKLLQRKYPIFWKKNISFNSVLHNRNNVNDIHQFIYNEFGKIPEIHPLNNSGIRPEQREKFKKMFRPYETTLKQDSNRLIKERFTSDPHIFGLCQFLLWYGRNQFFDYESFLYAPESNIKTTTGTCFPFSRKLYVTAQQKILVCERISHQYALGEIQNNNIILDTEKIAETYNSYYSKLYPQCKTCYMINGCHQCIFQLDDLNSKVPICKMYKSEEQMSNYIKNQIDVLEENHINYEKLFKEAILS